MGLQFRPVAQIGDRSLDTGHRGNSTSNHPVDDGGSYTGGGSTLQRQVFHVQPEGPLWAIKIQAGAALSQHDSKHAAVDEGRRMARANQPSLLVVHSTDGSVESETAYQDNPDPTPG